MDIQVKLKETKEFFDPNTTFKVVIDIDGTVHKLSLANAEMLRDSIDNHIRNAAIMHARNENQIQRDRNR